MLGLAVLFLVAAVLLLLGFSAAAVHRMTHPRRLTYATAIGRNLPASPADVGLDFVEESLTFSDGSRTPLWIVRGRNASGPIVILTHGWADGRYGVLAWCDLVADFASTMVLYDLRGQGESSAPMSELGTAEVDDLLALAAHVAREDRPIVLIGLSMGAGISIAAAAREPGLVAGVIGESAYRRGMQPVVGFFRINHWPIWPFYHLIGLWLTLRFTSDKRFDRAAHAARLRCPLLLLHGGQDPIAPVEAAREIAAAAPNAKLVVFDEASHLDLVKIDPARYREALAAFFTEIASRVRNREGEAPAEPL
jgi:3-oxoadipate enol-lactonase